MHTNMPLYTLDLRASTLDELRAQVATAAAELGVVPAEVAEADPQPKKAARKAKAEVAPVAEVTEEPVQEVTPAPQAESPALTKAVDAPVSASSEDEGKLLTALILEVAAMPAGNAPIQEILKPYGVARGRDLKPEDRGTVIAKLQNLKAGLPADADNGDLT